MVFINSVVLVKEIHFFKDGGVAADARELIQRDTAMLATAMDAELKK